MQKKEFFGALLLVSLVSTIMLTGIVLSTVGPSIFVYPSTGITASSDVYVYVTGSGWNPNAPVTLYWDQQNTNHTIAIMTPSTSGTFRLDQLEIERVPIGVHKIIAVQGVNTATCTYTVTATLPPDETLLDPIQQVENNLANTQSNFTTVISGLGDIEGKLDNPQYGLPGIQANLSQIESRLASLPNTNSWSNDLVTNISNVEHNVSEAIAINSFGASSKIWLTYFAYSNVSTVTARIYLLLPGGDTRLLDETPINNPSVQYNFYASREFQCTAEGILLTLDPSGPANVNIQWYLTIDSPQGVLPAITMWLF